MAHLQAGLNHQEETPSVLVLDGESSPALAIVRSLGKKGIRVDVGSSESHSIATWSKYCRDHFIYPDPLVDISRFREVLLDRLRRYRYSLIMPVTDTSICPLMGIRNVVEQLSPIAMASNNALAAAHSKGRTYELARRIGIPLPKTWPVQDLQDVHRVRPQLTFPIVVKPDRSKMWLPDGTGLRLSVQYELNYSDMIKTVASALKLGPVLLQECVPGPVVEIAVLAAKGRILFAYMGRGLHLVPITGGLWSYRLSEAVDAKALHYVSLLSGALEWDGVADIEFKEDERTGELLLLEINGRFWGSLPFAVATGADFPSYLFDLMFYKRRNFPSGYKIGLRGRNLLKEIAWFKAALFRDTKTSAIIQYPSYLDILLDSVRLLNPMECSDTLKFWDPMPGFLDLWGIARRIASRLLRKIE